MLRAYLIKLCRLNDSLAREVHVGLRLHEQNLFAAYLDLRRQRLEAQLVYADIKLLRHCVGGHEACVVPCSVKFGARVAEEYDKPCYTLCAAKSIKHGSTSNNYIRSARAKALALNLIIQTDWRWTFPRKHAGSPQRTPVLRTYI